MSQVMINGVDVVAENKQLKQRIKELEADANSLEQHRTSLWNTIHNKEDLLKSANEQVERVKYKLGVITRDNQELSKKIKWLEDSLVQQVSLTAEYMRQDALLKQQLKEMPKKICNEIRHFDANYNKQKKCYTEYVMDLVNAIDKIQTKYEKGLEDDKV